MTMHFRQLPDRFVADKDGKIVFDTDSFPVQFFGANAEINLTDIDLEFPDGVKGNSYSYGRGTISGQPNTGCASYITIGNQEWVQDTVVGTVPEGTDILLVMVNLQRTVTPSQILGKTIPVCIKQNTWVNATGGILLEALAPIVRVLQFFINDDWEVIQRIKQSVLNKSYSYFRSDNNPSLQGWTYGGAAGRKGHIVYGPVQAKGPMYDPSLALNARGTATQCSLTDPTNYASTYHGDIRIIPGIHRLTEEETGGSGTGRWFEPTGTWIQESVASSYSFSDVDLGTETDDRIVAVVVHGFYAGTPNQGMAVSSVTIAGVSATQVASGSYYNGSGGTANRGVAAVWVAAVPTGALGTVSVVLNSSSYCGVIDVYAMHGLASSTPTHAVGNSGLTSVGVSLNTVNGGICLFGSVVGVSGTLSPSIGSVSGISNAVVEWGAINTVSVGRGFQYGTGSTISPAHSVPISTFSRIAVCAAAFF